jgi:predicted transcriptional regulator
VSTARTAILAELARAGTQRSARDLATLLKLPCPTIDAALAELAMLGTVRRELLQERSGAIRAVWRRAGSASL